MKFPLPREGAMLPVGLGMALSLFGDLTLYAVLVTRLDELGLTLAQAGVLLSIHRLVRIPFNPLAGWIQDRTGRRLPFLAGLGLAVLSTAAYGLLHGFWPFVLARVAWGAAWSLINIGGITMALDLSNGFNRARLTGLYNTWMWLGYGATPLVGSLLTDRLGFSTAMLVCAGLSGIGLAAAGLLLPETLSRAARPSPETVIVSAAPVKPPAARRTPWPWKGMFLYGANQFAVDGVVLSTITLLVARRVGSQVTLAGLTLGAATFGGLVLSARAALAALSSAQVGRLSDHAAAHAGRTARTSIIAGGLLLGVLGVGLLAASQSAGAILLGVMVSALGASALQVSLPAQVGEETPTAQRALGMGQLVAAGDLGSTLGPALALGLAPLTGLAPVYLLAAGLFALGFAVAGGPRGLLAGLARSPAAPNENG